MKTDVKSRKLTVLQETLDQLFDEHLIPFELTVRKVEEQSVSEYEVPCDNSRLAGFEFSWKDDASLKEVLRSAVLIRVKGMSDSPLNDWIM